VNPEDGAVRSEASRSGAGALIAIICLPAGFEFPAVDFVR
jgi:hypothetical protein